MAKHNGNSAYRIYKRGNIWHAYISVVANGQRIIIRESTGTVSRDTANAWCTQRINKIINSPANTHEITLDTAAAKWWAEYGRNLASANSLSYLIKNILHYFNPDLPLSQISKLDISNFISKFQERGRTPATINRYLCCLSSICTRARENWDCNIPSFKILSFRLKEPRENIRFFRDMAEIQQLVDAAAEHLRPVIWCALYTGLRRGRILGLRWDQIDWDNRQIVYVGKDGAPNSVPLVEPLADILRKLPRTCEFVFTRRGKPVRDIKSAWAAAFARAGIPYRNFHALRHTTATWLLRQSGNLKVVQSVLGHRTLSVTTKYAHLVNDDSAQAMNNLFCTKSAQTADTKS